MFVHIAQGSPIYLPFALMRECVNAIKPHNPLYIITLTVRDRPFNLKGGWGGGGAMNAFEEEKSVRTFDKNTCPVPYKKNIMKALFYTFTNNIYGNIVSQQLVDSEKTIPHPIKFNGIGQSLWPNRMKHCFRLRIL